MAALVWVMIGLAIWHFTIFVPDRFWGGIVGAFVGAVIGSLLIGWLINGLSIPGQDDTNLLTALQAVPGALIGIAAVWFYGASKGNEPV
jgi:ABC-type xylose transport system permease subunit